MSSTLRNVHQFVDFKVVLYRLRFEDTDVITVRGKSGDVKLPVNFLFDVDFSRKEYDEIVDLFSGDKKTFIDFLAKYYALVSDRIDAAINAKPLVFNNSNPSIWDGKLFSQLDITPLVQSVSNSLSLEGANSCSISMLDPQIADFDTIELERYIHNASGVSSGNINETGTYADRKFIKYLQGIRVNEFDLVRVFAFSRTEQSPRDRRKALNDVGMDTGFAYHPIFTGVVSSISRANSVDSSASMSVTLIGLARMFMQSSTIFTDELANVVTSSDGSISTLRDKLTVTSTIFDGKSASQVVESLVDEYFHPRFLRDTSVPDNESTENDIVMGVPDWETLKTKMFVQDKSGSVKGQDVAPKKDLSKPVLIPFFPTVVLIHLLKLRYREPILVLDDSIPFREKFVHKVAGGKVDAIISQDWKALSGKLKPYLLRFRDNFNMYDANYSAPIEAINTIREYTYMEVYEDRTGAFHFRFPRYNKAVMDHDFGLDRIISVSFKRDDSGVYTTTVSKHVISLIGALTEVPGEVYMDKLAILRFGFRAPNISENPNAQSPRFATRLARFLREYNSDKTSRTATLSIVGDVNVNVGQIVSFRLGYPPRGKGGVTNLGGSGLKEYNSDARPENEIFVGYITNISENISVDGTYVQNLELSFVRPAAEPSEEVSFGAFTSGTFWDLFSHDHIDRTRAVASDRFNPAFNSSFPGGGQPGNSAVNLINFPNSIEARTPSTDRWLFNRRDPIKKTTIFKHTDSSVDLAKSAVDAPESKSRALNEGSAGLRDAPISTLKDRLKSNRISQDELKKTISSLRQYFLVMSKFKDLTYGSRDKSPGESVLSAKNLIGVTVGKFDSRLADFSERLVSSSGVPSRAFFAVNNLRDLLLRREDFKVAHTTAVKTSKEEKSFFAKLALRGVRFISKKESDVLVTHDVSGGILPIGQMIYFLNSVANREVPTSKNIITNGYLKYFGDSPPTSFSKEDANAVNELQAYIKNSLDVLISELPVRIKLDPTLASLEDEEEFLERKIEDKKVENNAKIFKASKNVPSSIVDQLPVSESSYFKLGD